MLLILFLVTTSLDADKGLQRQLPPIDNREEMSIDVNRDNILQLQITADNRIMIDDKPTSLSQLRKIRPTALLPTTFILRCRMK